MKRATLFTLAGLLALAIPLAAFAQTSSDRRFGFFWFGSTSGTASIYQRTPRIYNQNCQKKALLPALLPNQRLQCGKTGTTVRGLIWGDCPMVSCIVVPRETITSPFGPTGPQ